MGNIRKRFFSRILTILLLLTLLLAPAAQALTTEQARDLLTQYYVDEIPASVLDQDSIEDILLALGDPYTQYMNADEYAAFLASMEDSVVVGIGISAVHSDGGLAIAGVFSGSPAENAGLVAGDVITSVDGQNTAGQPDDTVAGWIRGEAGTQVTLQVLHADGSVQKYTLTRQAVVIATTTSDLVDGHICYIVCDAFGGDTLGHFQDGLSAYGDKTDRWVIDLRYNPGGDVSAAGSVLGLFLGEGGMVYLRNNAGDYAGYVSDTPSQTIYPVIVLTSQWTASASEIFSSAIRDLRGGLVIGGRTFGKGVAQILLDENTMPDEFSDGSALKVTAYRYFSAGGNTADQIGVIPHLLVSDENTGNIAWLLCASDPKSANDGVLRLHLGGWRWYLNLADATSDEMRPAFAELLEALPPSAKLFLGKGGGQWTETTAAGLAQQYDVDYTPRVFSDVASSPYQTEIDTLSTYEIVKGFGDGTFHPDSTMTRAELCALLAQAMNTKNDTSGNAFSDVPAGAGYAPYVNEMYLMGLVEGFGDGAFHPLDTITHEQFITIMARLSARLNLAFYETNKAGPGADALADQRLAAYSSWAKSSVWLLGESQKNPFGGEVNLLFAPVDKLDPHGATTRGEAAALLSSILTYTGILAD